VKTFDAAEERREFGHFNYFQGGGHMASLPVALFVTARTFGSCFRISLEA
jgi:hypothetical protein